MEKLLNLEYNQQIKIDKSTYTVIAMLKFTEGSSYWLEYILKDNDTQEQYFLDVEPSGKCAIHKMLNINMELDLHILYENELYELFQKGNAKIQTYFGYTDVGLKEEVEYYEYKNKEKLFTIEKWKDITEISSGQYIDKNKIKILKIEDDNYRL